MSKKIKIDTGSIEIDKLIKKNKKEVDKWNLCIIGDRMYVIPRSKKELKDGDEIYSC